MLAWLLAYLKKTNFLKISFQCLCIANGLTGALAANPVEPVRKPVQFKHPQKMAETSVVDHLRLTAIHNHAQVLIFDRELAQAVLGITLMPRHLTFRSL